MAINLKSMSRKELEKLACDVEKALRRMHRIELKKVRSEMEKLAAAHGVSLQDVFGASKRGGAVKPKSVAKYANPADSSETWTGKGRQPTWFKEAIAAGKTPDSMAI